MVLRVAAFVSFALGLAACRSRDTPAASQLTAAELDADTGPCVCRLPQDEGLTCCRGGIVLACACNGGGNGACNPVPTGRSCGSPNRR